MKKGSFILKIHDQKSNKDIETMGKQFQAYTVWRFIPFCCSLYMIGIISEFWFQKLKAMSTGNETGKSMALAGGKTFKKISKIPISEQEDCTMLQVF